MVEIKCFHTLAVPAACATLFLRVNIIAESLPSCFVSFQAVSFIAPVPLLHVFLLVFLASVGHTPSIAVQTLIVNGTPGETRTPDNHGSKPCALSTELQGHELDIFESLDYPASSPRPQRFILRRDFAVERATGTAGRTRTSDLAHIRRTLYATELQQHGRLNRT